MDLGAKFVVSDKPSDVRNWCGLQIEMGAELVASDYGMLPQELLPPAVILK